MKMVGQFHPRPLAIPAGLGAGHRTGVGLTGDAQLHGEAMATQRRQQRLQIGGPGRAAGGQQRVQQHRQAGNQ